MCSMIVIRDSAKLFSNLFFFCRNMMLILFELLLPLNFAHSNFKSQFFNKRGVFSEFCPWEIILFKHNHVKLSV